MIKGLRPYPAYRDSGVDWLGEVPEEWIVGRMKHSVQQVNETSENGMAGAPPVALEDVEGWTGRLLASNGGAEGQLKLFRADDVLFGKLRPYLAKVTRLPRGGSCVGEFLVLRTKGNDLTPRFLERLLRSQPFIELVNASTFGAKMPRANWHFIGGSMIPVPPLGHQAAIVRFLDHADRRIQRYIRSKQRLIELLGEEKQAIIHRAVTRGLDPSVELKPSGVAWVGDTPSTWEVRPLGTLLRERGETNRGGEVDDVLSLTRDRGVIPYAEKGNIGNKKSDDITRYKVVRPQDIVMNSMNVIIGSVGISVYTGCLSPVYYVLMPRSDQVFVPFVGAFFQTKAFQRSLTRIGNGILAHRMRIPMEALKREPIPLPPIDEQRLITDHLSTEENRLGVLLTIARKQVHLITEYHTRLISDVVTGKLDVREAATALPDDPDADDSALDAALEEAVA